MDFIDRTVWLLKNQIWGIRTETNLVHPVILFMASSYFNHTTSRSNWLWKPMRISQKKTTH